MAAKSPLDNVINLAKRRGFVFQAGEIYGGSRSAWDYGPLGVEPVSYTHLTLPTILLV